MLGFKNVITPQRNCSIISVSCKRDATVSNHYILAERQSLRNNTILLPFAEAVVAAVGADIDVILGLTFEAGKGIGIGTQNGNFVVGSISVVGGQTGVAADNLIVLSGRIGIDPVGGEAGALGHKGNAERRAARLTLHDDGPVLIDGGVLSIDTHYGIAHVEVAAQGVEIGDITIPFLAISVKTHLGYSASAESNGTSGTTEVGCIVHRHCQGMGF